MGIFIAAMTIKERNLTYMPSAKIGGGEGRKRERKKGRSLFSLFNPLPYSLPLNAPAPFDACNAGYKTGFQKTSIPSPWRVPLLLIFLVIAIMAYGASVSQNQSYLQAR